MKKPRDPQRVFNTESRRNRPQPGAFVEFIILTGIKDIEAGGIYINNVRDGSVARSVTTNDLLFGKHLLLRKGKRNYVVLSAK